MQIVTVEDISDGIAVDLPPNLQTYRQAGKVEDASDDQRSLGFE
jgi:hypothetical protein